MQFNFVNTVLMYGIIISSDYGTAFSHFLSFARNHLIQS
jgi:hypothetical protein